MHPAEAQGWTVVKTTDGLCTAAIKGTEVHVELHGPVLRRNIREVLGPVLEREGFVTTRVPRDDERSRKFVERMKFTKTWSDEAHDYYILTAMPFSKEH